MSISKPPFKFYLKQDEQTFYAISAGNVITTADPWPIIDPANGEESAPMNWADMDISFIRSPNWHGVMMRYAIPYEVTEYAARIMRHIQVEFGFDAVAYLYIERLNTFTNEYIPFDSQEFDLTNFRSDYTVTSTDLLPGGIQALIESRESTVYEIPLDEEKVKFEITGPFLTAAYKYAMGTGSGTTATQTRVAMPLGFAVKDGEYEVGATRNPVFLNMGTTNTPFPQAQQDNFFFQAGLSMTATVFFSNSITFTSDNANADDARFELRLTQLLDGQNTRSQDILLYQDPALLAPGQSRTLNINFTSLSFTVNAKARYYLEMRAFIPNETQVNNFTISWGNGNFNILPVFRLATSQAEGFRPATLFRKLIQSLTDYKSIGVSGFLSNPNIMVRDNKPYNTIISPGDSIRNLSDAKVKTTLSEFFQFATSVWMMGLGIENGNVRMEPLTYFYDRNTMILDLTEWNPQGVIDFSWQVNNEDLANELKVGYEDQNNDTLNGRYDAHSYHIRQMPVLRPKGEINLISPYIASPFAIESIRNKRGQDTTDKEGDNKNYLAVIDDTATNGVYPLERDYSIAFGIPNAESGYNYSITPLRNARRNDAYVRASLPPQLNSDYINLNSSPKNTDLVSGYPNAATIAESAGIPVGAMGTPLYLPYLFNFRAASRISLIDQLNANPYGYVRFPIATRTGEISYLLGFIQKAGQHPADNEVYEWTLLAHPDTDLNVLKDYGN